jgi:hypothetical protein
MPRYFFNVYDGRSAIDREGIDLPDRDHARREAIRLSGNILYDESQRVSLSEEWHMEVVDEQGLILFRFDFTTTVSAAISASSRRP